MPKSPPALAPTYQPLPALNGQVFKLRGWHPYWSVLLSPFLILTGAPLGVVQHRHRSVWLAVYYSLLVAAATLLGISYAPRIQPDPASCCHPPRSTLSQKAADAVFGPCHDLTPLGKSHPDIKASHCSRRTYTEALLIVSGLAALAAAIVICLLAGWVRLYKAVKADNAILRDPNEPVRAKAAVVEMAILHSRHWHRVDLFVFAIVMLAYVLYGYDLDFYQDVLVLAGLFVWWVFLSPSAHVFHQLLSHSRIAGLLGGLFLVSHEILIPIARFWHCCPRGLAWECKERRSACDAGYKDLRQWPTVLWVAYGISLSVAIILVVLGWFRLRHAHSAWKKGLDVLLSE